MNFARKILIMAIIFNTLALSAACDINTRNNQERQTSATNSNSLQHENKRDLILGFSQIGDESEWRSANTQSIKTAAKDAGIELIFSDAYQQQQNQIDAIRSFINQRVDVIAFSPIVETGWDEVLNEAKDAGIPVFITDRKIQTNDESLYVTCIGADFEEEGRKAGNWLVNKLKNFKRTINIFELEGTSGSTPMLGRKEGFDQVISKYPGLKIVGSADGEFLRSKGKEIIESVLKSKKYKIDVLFSHNDDMALGAIRAFEEYGIKPGKDVIIISVDAVREAFDAMIAGKLNCTVECNPLLGSQLMNTIIAYFNGIPIPKRTIIQEGIFTQENAKTEISGRKY